MAAPEGVDQLLVLHSYDPIVRRLILAAKNGARRDLLDRFGGDLGDLLMSGTGRRGSTGSADFAVVTWVPAGRRAARRRGYDQGRLLAGAVAERTGVPPRRLLVRRRGPERTGADRARRLEGPALRTPLRCEGRVLLVDDVVTTGASLRAGAQALRRAGATTVTALAIARA